MAAADTTKPVLTGLDLPFTIDLSGGTQTVNFGARATDIGLGVDSVVVWLDHSLQGAYGESRSALSFYDRTDSFTDGVSIDSEQIAQSTASGTYNITSVSVTDKAGNTSSYSSGDLVALGLKTSFEVTGGAPPDTAKPVLTGFDFPDTIDLSAGGIKTVGFKALASDVGLGVDHVSVFLDHSFQTQYGQRSSLNFSDQIDSFTDGELTDSEQFSSGTASGVYQFTTVIVTDKAGNSTYYTGSDLDRLGIKHSFVVSGGAPADSVKPTLTGLDLPTTIDLSGGTKTVSFGAHATDQGLGVDSVSVYLDHAFQTPYGRASSLLFTDRSDSFSDGVSIDNEIMSSGSASGTYNITSVMVTDKAGNITQYFSNDLAALGIKSSFNITDGGPVAPTVVVNAPPSVLEGNDQNFNLSLTFKNVTTLNAMISVAPGQGTASNGIDMSVPNGSYSVSVAQAQAGDYTYSLGSIPIYDDLIAEGKETIAITIKVPGQIFANGTDSTTVEVALNDNDYAGTAGPDVLLGTSANETFRGLAGNDTINGGGADIALFSSNLAQNSISFPIGSQINVTGPEGTDSLLNIATIQFADGKIIAASALGVESLYKYWGGRDASAPELSYWTNEIAAGRATAQSVRDAIVNDPLGQANMKVSVTALYETYGGRAPTSSELGYWQSAIVRGADFATVRSAILDDPLGQNHSRVEIGALYQEYGGRAPSEGEVAVWTGLIRSGAGFAAVRDAILADPLGLGHAGADANAFYRNYAGHAPTSLQLTEWIAAEHRSPSGGADGGSLAARIDSAYEEFGGRAPTDSELGVWADAARRGDIATIRDTILDDPLGQGHSSAEVAFLYQEYGGRAPTSGETAYWVSHVRAGATYTDVRAAILDDPLGQNHGSAEIGAIYQQYFGRSATSSEVDVWKGLIRSGATYASMADTLLSDYGSDATGTQRLTGTSNPDRFSFAGHFGNAVIDAFVPGTDKIQLSGIGINPLDAQHATQIDALSGSTDVLISFSANDHLLLHNVTLAQLHVSDFSFG